MQLVLCLAWKHFLLFGNCFFYPLFLISNFKESVPNLLKNRIRYNLPVSPWVSFLYKFSAFFSFIISSTYIHQKLFLDKGIIWKASLLLNKVTQPGMRLEQVLSLPVVLLSPPSCGQKLGAPWISVTTGGGGGGEILHFLFFLFPPT